MRGCNLEERPNPSIHLISHVNLVCKGYLQAHNQGICFADVLLLPKGSTTLPQQTKTIRNCFMSSIGHLQSTSVHSKDESLSNAKCSKPDISRANPNCLVEENQQVNGGMSQNQNHLTHINTRRYFSNTKSNFLNEMYTSSHNHGSQKLGPSNSSYLSNKYSHFTLP